MARGKLASNAGNGKGGFTFEQVHALWSARPFRPFEIKLANGARIPVRIPMNFGFNADHSLLIGAAAGAGFEFFDVSQIVGCRMLRAVSKRPSKGRGIRKRAK